MTESRDDDRIGFFEPEYPQLSEETCEHANSDTLGVSVDSSPLLEDDFFEDVSSSDFSATFYLLCVTHFFTCMDQLLTSPHLTDIARSFGMDDVDRDKKIGGQSHMVLLMGGVPFLLVAAMFSDRIYCKQAYVFVMTVVFASDVCVYFATNYAEFLALRCCASLQTSTWPLIICFLCRMYHEDARAAKLSFVGASASVGMGAGQVLSLFAGDHMRWRLPFLIVGVVGLASTAVFAMLGENPKALKNKSTETGQKWYHAPFSGISRNNAIIIVQGMLQCVPTILMAVFINDYLFIDRHAQSKLAAFGINAMFGIGIFIGQICAPHLFECIRRAIGSIGSKLGVLKFIICGLYLVPVLPIISIVRAPFSAWLAVPSFTAGFALGSNDILTSVATLHLNNYATHFKVMSFYSIADSIGKGVGAVVISEIIACTDRKFAFTVTPLFWVVCSVIFCFVKVKST